MKTSAFKVGMRSPEDVSEAACLLDQKAFRAEDVVAILEGIMGELVDGRPYADPAFIAELERYHELAVEAHREHTPLSAPLPPLPGTVYGEVVSESELPASAAAWTSPGPSS